MAGAGATVLDYSKAVFGNFPIPVAGKTGTAEKVVPLPGYLASLAVVGRDRTLLCLEEPSAADFATGSVGAEG
mgnify:CR=1 FL=1